MRLLRTLLTLFAFSPHLLQAQTTYATGDKAYITAVEKAFMALKNKDCRACLREYERAFAISQKSALSLLRAATCAYGCEEMDLARAFVHRAVTADVEAADEIWADLTEYPELATFRQGQMQEIITEELQNAFHRYGFNAALRQRLVTIYEQDQRPRQQLDSVSKVYGWDSPETRMVVKKMAETDSVNLPEIETIIQKHGYPGKSKVGERMSETAWLVIQHAPLAVQEKYLPVLQKAADKGELSRSSLALLIDRVRLGRGQKQLYGSQVTGDEKGNMWLAPIEDEANVNKRRASVGLEPIEDYAKQFNIDYKAPATKKARPNRPGSRMSKM
ncbi:DUF6624 domain-containing protein [Tellurirhabdus rosea]|uniref:DUF6624 domain-containing protein n=1 Tax=Tellurirhabdus rosea TaxID=2674997 RepID=UPI00224E2CD0|nr:DUF6624 domain-containing protein [Tellurirhabdus rosea]